MNSETEYKDEQNGIWGDRTASWTCDECGDGLLSPAQFKLVDGENVCNSCLG